MLMSNETGRNKPPNNNVNASLNIAQRSLRKAIELVGRIQKNRPIYSPAVLTERLWIITHEMEEATNKMRHTATLAGPEPENWGGVLSESGEVIPPEDLNDEIPDNSCRITLHKHWYGVKINMPLLVANRRNGWNNFYSDMLNDRLKVILGSERPYRFGRCVVVFENIYAVSKIKKQPPVDPDNLELQAVLNVLAKYFIKDDTALQCSLFITANTGPFSVTHIYIVAIEDFPMWVSRRQKALNPD